MLFRSSPFLGLGFDFPLQTFPLGLNCPPGAQTVNHHKFQLLRVFCSSKVLHETSPVRVLDRRCESGLAAFTKVKQEVSHICSM
jgi:hypothetical protein